MDLAIARGMTDMIENITQGATEGDDPEVLKKSADILLQNRQYNKAVEILISLGNLNEALDIAEQ